MITHQIWQALDAAHIENRYPHDFRAKSYDIVREIIEYSGLEHFDENSFLDVREACQAVITWRDARANLIEAC